MNLLQSLVGLILYLVGYRFVLDKRDFSFPISFVGLLQWAFFMNIALLSFFLPKFEKEITRILSV